jgi:hypothetical protein
MLKRWDVRVYDVGFLMAALDYVLDFMDFDSKIDGRRFWRPPRLYVKALVLKEVFKASLRYAGELSLIGVRIPKSTTGRLGMGYCGGGFENNLQAP